MAQQQVLGEGLEWHGGGASLPEMQAKKDQVVMVARAGSGEYYSSCDGGGLAAVCTNY